MPCCSLHFGKGKRGVPGTLPQGNLHQVRFSGLHFDQHWRVFGDQYSGGLILKLQRDSSFELLALKPDHLDV